MAPYAFSGAKESIPMIDQNETLLAEQWGTRVESAYLEHRERIVDLLRAKHPLSTVEDAMQEIFLQLLCRMPKSPLAREVTLSAAYLFECVRRRLLRTLENEQRKLESTRNACRRGAIDSSHSTNQKSDPVHSGDPDFDEDQLASALEQLSPKQQEVLRLICAENVRRHDGSKSLGCEENCFGVRRHRALIALREILIRGEERVGRSDPRKRLSDVPTSPRHTDDTAKEIST